MSTSYGGCGRGAIHYGDELAVLYGLLTLVEDAPRVPFADDRREWPLGATRCEHGVKLTKNCATCAFMFGWESTSNQQGGVDNR